MWGSHSHCLLKYVYTEYYKIIILWYQTNTYLISSEKLTQTFVCGENGEIGLHMAIDLALPMEQAGRQEIGR